MDIFNVLSLFGGLALFLYGMTAMSNGLEKMAGSKLGIILRKLTSNKFKGLAFGACAAAVVQSSAVTVTLVGLVNSGVMKLSQAISVIMGSNIGTTMNAWLLSLAGIESNSTFVQMLKPINFSPILALIGIILIMGSKKEKKKDIGGILIGFAILMFGMNMMSESVAPLADMPEFQHILVAFRNPLLGVLVGTLFTAVIQSSAASIGVLQALSLTGAFTYSTVVPIVMGQNIGTCISALLASLGTNKNAKRVATVHILFNVLGTTVFLALWLIINKIFVIPFANDVVEPYNIAIIHSIFNIGSTIILIPFSSVLEKLAYIIIKDKDSDEEKNALLDKRLLKVPSVAVSKTLDVTIDMAMTAQKSVLEAIEILRNFSPKGADDVAELEDKIDRYEDKIGTFLLKFSTIDLSKEDNAEISTMLHTLADFERIGDHALNLAHVANEIETKEIKFSESATNELNVLYKAVTDVLDITCRAFADKDPVLAQQVEPLEDVIDTLTVEIKNRHVERLRSGNCTIEIGFILTDMLTNFQRISDHCSNIAIALIEADKGTKYDAHAYLNKVKKQENGVYAESFDKYLKEYAI